MDRKWQPGHRTIYQSKKNKIYRLVVFNTPSTGKLAFLNNLVGVFEYESDESGNTSAKVGSGSNSRSICLYSQESFVSTLEFKSIN
jgi:hypothetical protein